METGLEVGVGWWWKVSCTVSGCWVLGRMVVCVRLSMTVASARVPCTTACSPTRIALPGAEARTPTKGADMPVDEGRGWGREVSQGERGVCGDGRWRR